MLKLIKLEWKKNNIKKYIRSAFIISATLLLLILLTIHELTDGPETIPPYGRSLVVSAVDLFNNMSYIIFTSVMAAAFSVSPYKNRTIYLMFSYPINRKKILLSQVMAVWVFNFTSLVLSKISFYCLLLLTRPYTHISADSLPLGSYGFYFDILVGSAAVVSISFLAMFAGLRMKSSKAAIVTGIIIACCTQGNIGSYTLTYNLPFYCILLLLSFTAVYLSVRHIETEDVI